MSQGNEVQVIVGDVNGDDAVACEAFPIEGHGLTCQQVGGYRVAAESVQHEQIESSVTHPLQDQPPVTQVMPDFRPARVEKREVLPGDLDDGGVDLDHVKLVGLAAVGRENPAAESDNADC